MRWQCELGHAWEASLDNVKNRGSWCPQCPFKNEDESRRILESLTEKSFDKCRPGWLEGLELDGYNKELRLAFEYQGEQHYRYIPHFHRGGESDLDAQKERDRRKAELCEENWVTLITIPFWEKDKRKFIRDALLEYGYELIEDDEVLEENLEETENALNNLVTDNEDRDKENVNAPHHIANSALVLSDTDIDELIS